MDENNQILDVTYGNFSCRLEGFDDSVETMKTVVSFFHDLAGHDRFMDVEPQAPDMATLALLTQEQTGMPVDVEGEGNHVSLRVRKDPVEDDLSDEIAALEDASEDDSFEADVSDDGDVEDDDATLAAETDADEDFDVDASVADKLERIRAVVDGGSEPQSDDFVEDLNDDDDADTSSANPLSQRLAELASRSSDESDLSEDETADADDMMASDDDDLGKLRNVFDDVPSEEEAEDAVAEQALGEDTADADDLAAFEDDADASSEDADDLAAALDALEDEDGSTEMDDDVLSDPDNVLDVEAADETTDVEMPQEQDVSDDDLSEDDTAGEPSDADDDIAAEAESDEKPQEDETEEPVLSRRSPLMLTDSDEVTKVVEIPHQDDDFNLQEEVAKVEAEIAARNGNEVARHGLPRSVEDAMSRIMSQTDQHLNQPESRRHRDAFAQLKAAVAATEAARQLGDQGETRDPDADFKDDLGAHAAEEKDQAQAAPPLKLVKSEMIEPENTLEKPQDLADAPAPSKEPASQSKTRIIEAPEEPVAQAPVEKAPKTTKPMDAASERLRQIAALKETEGAVKSTGFAEFAAAHGATDLVDKLEAAGAYICLVEGNADFSRPQVMKVVQSATDEEITREDGLRCFGRLLRQARLIKLNNGRFQVAENTQYRPDGDQAAQG